MQVTDKAHEPKDLDLSAAGRGVWLVKAPKYLSERWKKVSSNGELGRLRITRSKLPGQKPDVTFTSNDTISNMEIGGSSCPKEHKFVLTGVGSQNLVVFSQLKVPITAEAGNSGSQTTENYTERLAIDGKVIQRAECRPVADASYLRLKRIQLETKNKPKREVKQLDTVVMNYKPIKDHQHNIDHEAKKKEEGKRSRADADVVRNMLFSAFEKHQYYNVKDLMKITNQPITYLKEILKDICIYNMKAPHRYMWELKPENRHYKDNSK